MRWTLYKFVPWSRVCIVSFWHLRWLIFFKILSETNLTFREVLNNQYHIFFIFVIFDFRLHSFFTLNGLVTFSPVSRKINPYLLYEWLFMVAPRCTATDWCFRAILATFSWNDLFRMSSRITFPYIHGNSLPPASKNHDSNLVLTPIYWCVVSAARHGATNLCSCQ